MEEKIFREKKEGIKNRNDCTKGNVLIFIKWTQEHKHVCTKNLYFEI